MNHLICMIIAEITIRFNQHPKAVCTNFREVPRLNKLSLVSFLMLYFLGCSLADLIKLLKFGPKMAK